MHTVMNPNRPAPMKTYLVVYYGSVVPTFSYADTLKEARSYALILLNSHHCKRNDVLSIVNTVTDSVIYYGKRDELIRTFNAIDYKTGPADLLCSLSLKPVLNWIGMKVSDLTIG